jgi:hypothetical protein
LSEAKTGFYQLVADCGSVADSGIRRPIPS